MPRVCQQKLQCHACTNQGSQVPTKKFRRHILFGFNIPSQFSVCRVLPGGV